MSPLDQVVEHFKSKLGQKDVAYLGEVTALMIRRFALAVGDDTPIYYDRAYAQNMGYPDIIAPPNMLVSIIQWDEGVKEKDLRLDGVPIGKELPSTPGLEKVRIMGGGEKIDFHQPVVAGTHVTLTTELSDVYTRKGRKGLIAFIVYTNTYKDQNENILCISKKTKIAR